jgi:hypothetical protein
VAHETQKGTNTRSLLEQPGLTVAVGAVSLVGEQQAAEVSLVATPRSAFGLGKGSLFASRGWSAKSPPTTGRRQVIIKPIDALQ